MRTFLVMAALALGAGRVQAAGAAAPAAIGVTVQCEQLGRTKACPAFLLGFVDAHKVLLNVPRAVADVVVYATANQVGNSDMLHLRFVGTVTGAPKVIELDVELDTRGNDDAQRAQLEPAFLRGIALFVAARHPGAVKIALSEPAGLAEAPGTSKSPWGIALNINGNGSYTERFRSGEAEAALVGRYLKPRFRALTLTTLAGGAERQPPLMLEDGTVVSLDINQWAFRTGAEAVHLFDDTWSIGVGSYSSFEDPRAQTKFSSRTRAALEWDLFPSNDPRGNRLGVFAHLGYVVERYNIRNDIGERFAHYEVGGIDAVGSIRKDKITVGLELQTGVQLRHPTRRRTVTAAPFAQIQLGSRIDLNLSVSITQRELPAPDMSQIDPSDFAQLSRLQFAEPLSITGSIGISIHFDPTNGVRNDRIESI